jgi:segregation and condensation protein A
LSEANSVDEYSHFFEVKLECFDGPIDLLLHLVKQNELPIEKVALAEVTSQYLSCIERMRDFDLEVAGEYLLIAATLISIKSSVLLNEPVELVLSEDGVLVDPHEELLRRLREAEIYREGASYLGNREMLGVDVFSPPSSIDEIEPPPFQFKDHDPMLLGRAFRKLLSQAKDPVLMTITVDSVSIVERMMTIIDTLKAHSGRLPFQRVIPDLNSRASIVSSFCALLELCKRHIISVVQDGTFDEISIVLAEQVAGESAQSMNLSSDFDEPVRADDSSDGGKTVNA